MIDVQFENSKVLVGFRSNTNAQNRRPGQASSIGEVTTTKTNLTPIVLHHVYVSMKLKMQSREQLKIRLYRLSEAQRYLKCYSYFYIYTPAGPSQGLIIRRGT